MAPTKSHSGQFVTRFETRETSITWTLENFGLCDKEPKEFVESEVFPKLDGDSCEWHLHLYPFGDSIESKDYVSIFLCVESDERDSILAQYVISFQDLNDKPIAISNYETRRFESESSRGYSTFISRNKLLANLLNDVLVVKCSVKWQESVSNETITSNNEAATAAETEAQSNLSGDFHQLMSDGILSDVNLLAKDHTQFRAHKCVLSARSPVFAVMFQHDMRERRQSTVQISDINADTLESMLDFIYSGKIIQNKCCVKELLAAADKYALEDLKVLCQHNLIKQLTIQNTVENLFLADKHNAKILKEHTLKLITVNLRDVLKTNEFKRLNLAQTAQFYEILEKEDEV